MIRSLCAAALLALPAALLADDIEFFEKKYGIKLPGVKPKEQYDDPDAYYSEIARHLGIPDIAFKEAAGKFGWKEDDKKVTKTIVRRGSNTDQWEVMIFRFPIDPASKRPDVGSMKSFLVVIDDDKKARSVDRYEDAVKKARQKRDNEKRDNEKRDNEKREKGDAGKHDDGHAPGADPAPGDGKHKQEDKS